MLFTRAKQGLGLVFVAGFAAVWIYIGIKVLQFTPTTTQKTYDLDTTRAALAGFLASAVAAGTAAVLGIKIQQVKTAAPDASIAARVAGKVVDSAVLLTSVVVYAGVGIFVIAVWWTHGDVSPDFVRTFALGVFGWLAGCFAGMTNTGDGT